MKRLTWFMVMMILVGGQTGLAAALLKNKVYFVGVGPAGPDLCTLRAIRVIKQADVVYAPEYIKKNFAEYLRGKDVRPGWPDYLYRLGKRQYTALNDLELMQKGQMVRHEAKRLASEWKALWAKGKTVAFLILGDPCLYSNLHWFNGILEKDQIEVIPGLSALNAGAAMLRREISLDSSGLRSTVILFSPLGQELRTGNAAAELARHRGTMVLFMAGGRIKSLAKSLLAHYPADTPVAACYFIGYPARQSIIRATLASIAEKMAKVRETRMVLIFVGPFLRQ
jgi:precorrin-4 methylase